MTLCEYILEKILLYNRFTSNDLWSTPSFPAKPQMMTNNDYDRAQEFIQVSIIDDGRRILAKDEDGKYLAGINYGPDNLYCDSTGNVYTKQFLNNPTLFQKMSRLFSGKAIASCYYVKGFGSVDPHAGIKVMKEFLKLCLKNGVGIAAHPAAGTQHFYNRLGFQINKKSGMYFLSPGGVSRIAKKFRL